MLTHVCSYPGCATPTDPVPRKCKTCPLRSHHWHMTEEWLPAHPECQSPASGYHGWCFWCLHDQYGKPPPPNPRPPEPPATPTHINLDTPSPANAAHIILQLQSSSAGSDESTPRRARGTHLQILAAAPAAVEDNGGVPRCTHCTRHPSPPPSPYLLPLTPLPLPTPSLGAGSICWWWWWCSCSCCRAGRLKLVACSWSPVAGRLYSLCVSVCVCLPFCLSVSLSVCGAACVVQRV